MIAAGHCVAKFVLDLAPSCDDLRQKMTDIGDQPRIGGSGSGLLENILVLAGVVGYHGMFALFFELEGCRGCRGVSGPTSRP